MYFFIQIQILWQHFNQKQYLNIVFKSQIQKKLISNLTSIFYTCEYRIKFRQLLFMNPLSYSSLKHNKTYMNILFKDQIEFYYNRKIWVLNFLFKIFCCQRFLLRYKLEQQTNINIFPASLDLYYFLFFFYCNL